MRCDGTESTLKKEQEENEGDRKRKETGAGGYFV